MPDEMPDEMPAWDRDARPQGEELRPGLPGCSHGVVEALPVTEIVRDVSRDANHDFPRTPLRKIRDRSNRAVLVENENRSRQNGRPASRSPISDNAPIFDQLTSPDSPGLDAFECFVEARSLQRTSGTDRLGPGNVDIVITEEQWGQRAVPVCAACSSTVRSTAEHRSWLLGCDCHCGRHCLSPCGCEWLVVGSHVSDGADRFEDKEKDRRVIPAASSVLVVVVNLRE
jgi:hypothetical protein